MLGIALWMVTFPASAQTTASPTPDHVIRAFVEAAAGFCPNPCDAVGSFLIDVFWPEEDLAAALQDDLERVNDDIDALQADVTSLRAEISALRENLRLELAAHQAIAVRQALAAFGDGMSGTYQSALELLDPTNPEHRNELVDIADDLAELLRLALVDIETLPELAPGRVPADYARAVIGDYLTLAALRISMLQEVERLRQFGDVGLRRLATRNLYTALEHHSDFVYAAGPQIVTWRLAQFEMLLVREQEYRQECYYPFGPYYAPVCYPVPYPTGYEQIIWTDLAANHVLQTELELDPTASAEAMLAEYKATLPIHEDVQRQVIDVADMWMAMIDTRDRDGDGVTEPFDNCVAEHNRDQTDANADGIGDACECGDQNGDGLVNLLDVHAIQDVLFGRAPASPLCDTNEDGACTLEDLFGVVDRMLGQETFCAARPSVLPPIEDRRDDDRPGRGGDGQPR